MNSLNSQYEVFLLFIKKYLRSGRKEVLEKINKHKNISFPSWHIGMMNDSSRNQFYRTEIGNQAKGKNVLDLGAGFGFLTWVALESGAKHVYALEENPFIVTILEDLFADEISNGRVTLLSMHSSLLNSSHFKRGQPDLIVHEIFGNTGLSEWVIDIFEDLFNRKVLTPEMSFLPNRFSIHCCAHYSTFINRNYQFLNPEMRNKFQKIESLMTLMHPSVSLPYGQEGDASSPYELLNIDLNQFEPRKESELKIVLQKEANCLRVWFNFYGNSECFSSDQKLNPGNHWANQFYSLDLTGKTTDLKVTYNGGELYFKNQ